MAYITLKWPYVSTLPRFQPRRRTTSRLHPWLNAFLVLLLPLLVFMETLAHVPRWRDYYLAHDQTSTYEYLATQLKALQFLRGGDRWLLKSPQHLEKIPVLERVFPGLVLVCTHRDPVPVALSIWVLRSYAVPATTSVFPRVVATVQPSGVSVMVTLIFAES